MSTTSKDETRRARRWVVPAVCGLTFIASLVYQSRRS
jgi:hypothetical protein